MTTPTTDKLSQNFGKLLNLAQQKTVEIAKGGKVVGVLMSPEILEAKLNAVRQDVEQQFAEQPPMIVYRDAPQMLVKSTGNYAVKSSYPSVHFEITYFE